MRGRLGKLDRARSEFIANASHELRTPLFSLGGFLELMADEEVDEETRREFLETMREQVDRLAKLATDLLDLSRLDAGRMRVEHEPVDLGEVARVVSAEFSALAERRKHDVETVVQGSPVARADEQRVLQVVRALLDNAITHTPEGTRVTLRAWADREHASLEVEDDGPDRARARRPRLRPLLSRRWRGRLRQRSRARDRPRARADDGRRGHTRVAAGTHRPARVLGLHRPRSRPSRPSPFSRENGGLAATVSRMRAGALAAVSIVAACLGAALVLVVGSAAGWVGADDGVRTVVVSTLPTESGAAAPTAAPLLGNSFDPAKDLREPLRRGRHDLLLFPERRAGAGFRLHRPP